MKAFVHFFLTVFLLSGCGGGKEESVEEKLSGVRVSALNIGDNSENRVDLIFSLGCSHCIDMFHKNMSVLRKIEKSAEVRLIEIPGMILGGGRTAGSADAGRRARSASTVTRCAVTQGRAGSYLDAVERFVSLLQDTYTDDSWKNWPFATESDLSASGKNSEFGFDNGYGVIRRFAAAEKVDIDACAAELSAEAYRGLPAPSTVPIARFTSWSAPYASRPDGYSSMGEFWFQLHDVGARKDKVPLIDPKGKEHFIKARLEEDKTEIETRFGARHVEVRPTGSEQWTEVIGDEESVWLAQYPRVVAAMKQRQDVTAYIEKKLRRSRLEHSFTLNSESGLKIRRRLAEKHQYNTKRILNTIDSLSSASAKLEAEFSEPAPESKPGASAVKLTSSKSEKTPDGPVWKWSANLEPDDIGRNSLGNGDGVIENLAPHWRVVRHCRDLTIKTQEGRLVLFGAVRADGDYVDMACAMEKAGHKLTHVAYVSGSYFENDPPKSAYFYQVRLADGHRLIVDGSTGGSSRNAQGGKKPNKIFLYTNFQRAFSLETQRLYNDFRNRTDLVAENRPLALLLLGGAPDALLTRIGLGGGDAGKPGERAAPVEADIARALRKRVNDFYPANGCLGGFKSRLKIDPSIEVCVNFNDIRNLECKRIRRGDDRFNCTFDMTVIPGSSTHPNLNQMFRDMTGTTTITSAEFYYDRGEYVLLADGASIAGIIPEEFR